MRFDFAGVLHQQMSYRTMLVRNTTIGRKNGFAPEHLGKIAMLSLNKS